jgi:serine/threonine protein kinase
MLRSGFWGVLGVQNRRGLSENIALYYLRQLLEALDALHSMDIYHLDVKTDNLMLDENFQLKLVDFSCCFLQDGELDEASEMAINKRVKTLLTPHSHHVPPEFRLPSRHARLMELPAEEKLAVFEKADVWSAGMAALTMFSACYCFSEPGTVDANRRTFAALILRDDHKFWHCVGELVTWHKRTFRPSEGMKELLMEMLCANHHERPTAAELLERPILAPHALPAAEEVATYMRQRGI